jgi:ABC-type lipoprotein release transport system permease subunit
MSLFKIAWRSIQQRALASVMTGLSMALGVALVVAVLVFQGVIANSFSRAAEGYDIIIGAKGGRLELVLNTVFHLGQPIENVPWNFYKEFTREGVTGSGKPGKYASVVDVAVPFCLGDNYKGYRVVGTTPDLFNKLGYGIDAEGQPIPYQFQAGKSFKQDDFFGAVIGSVVARRTGLRVGDKFEPTHGVTTDEEMGHKHDPFIVRGILAPNGTPNDRALFVNMEGFFLLEGHAKEHEAEKPGAKHAHDEHDHKRGDDHDHADHQHEHDGDHKHDDAKKTEGSKQAAEVKSEAKSDEAKADASADEAKSDEAKSDEAKSDEAKSDEAKSDEAKSDEAKSDEPKSDEPKSDEPKSDEPKSDEPKSDEPKSEAASDDSCQGSESAQDHDHDHKPAAKGHDHAHDHDHDHGHDHSHHGHDHDHAHHHEPLPEDQREVTAILIRSNSPTVGLTLPRSINKGQIAQAVMPIGEIRKLFDGLIGNLQMILLVLAVLIVVVAGIGIMVSIYNSMSERRREIAIMRALGAGRGTVRSLILLESVILSVVGGAAGFLLGHGLIGLLSPFIAAQTGVPIGAFQFVPYELILIPGLIVLAALAGYIPALSAYRTDVSRALSATP